MKSPLASGAVYVTSRYATRPGARYKGYEQRAIALLELILIEVVYGMHLNPRMEPQSLLHSEDLKMAPLVEPSEVRKLQLASFGSTRLKGEGFAAAAQEVEEFAAKEKLGASQRASEVYST